MAVSTQTNTTTHSGAALCKVCVHADRDEIHAALAKGETVFSLSLKYAGAFSRDTLHRHLMRCVQANHRIRREELAHDSKVDLQSHFDTLLSECQDALIAAKRVLLVDGDLCFDPRAWEINVVYLDHEDRNEQGEPKLKQARLSKLLAKISEAGSEPQHSYIKSEDMRKTFRDCVEVFASIVDRTAKLTGAYKTQDERTDRLNYLRDQIQRAAIKFGTTYEHELGVFLEDHAHGIRPDLKTELEREYAGMGGGRGYAPARSPVSSPPLAAAAGLVKDLPPSPDQIPELSETEVGSPELLESEVESPFEIQPESETPIKLGEFFPETMTNA